MKRIRAELEPSERMRLKKKSPAGDEGDAGLRKELLYAAARI